MFFRLTFSIALVAYPIVALLTRAGSTVCFYALFAISLCMIVVRQEPTGMIFPQFLKKYWLLNLTMVGMLITTSLSELYWGNFQPQQFYFALRLATFAVIFWGCQNLSSREISRIQWGIVAGAILCAIYYYVLSAGGNIREYHFGKMALIAFSDLTLLMGFLACLSIGWHERDSMSMVLLKMIALVGGLLTSFLAQTRGGWIALPFFVLLLGYFFWKTGRKKLVIAVCVVIVLIGAYALGKGTIQNRLQAVKSDVTQYQEGAANTSLGLRFQLWKGSWLMFKDNPVVGVGGRDGFIEKLEGYASKGIVHPVTPTLYHAHNEAFFQMAMHGIFGLMSLLALYLVPSWFALKFVRHDDAKLKTAAFMVIMLTGGFFIFGLTEVFFGLTKDIGNFYLIFLAALCAFLVKRKKELSSGSARLVRSEN